jgi:hypothetical protein
MILTIDGGESTPVDPPRSFRGGVFLENSYSESPKL